MEDILAEPAQDAAEPEQQAATEPEVAAEPALDDLPEVAPTWLDEPEEPTAPAPQYQQQGYSQQAQWEQPQAQKPPSKSTLESFVNDPDGTIDRLVNERLMQHLGPMAYQLQNTQMTSQRFIQAQAQSAVQQARKAVESGYKEVLNKDEAFRSHKGVQDRVNRAMRGMWQQASIAAMQGDPRRLQELSNPVTLKAALYMAKELEGYKPRATSEYSPRGATVESTKSKGKTAPTRTLDADTEAAIASRLGPGAVERYRKAYAETSADDDITFYD